MTFKTFIELPLSNGMVFKVDIEDVPKIFIQSWHAFPNHGKVYVRGWGIDRKKKVMLHRYLLNIYDRRVQVDHKNGDPLDNRKSNLRLCNNSQNIRNRKARGFSEDFGQTI